MKVKAKMDFCTGCTEVILGDTGEGFWKDGHFCAKMPGGNVVIEHDDFFDYFFALNKCLSCGHEWEGDDFEMFCPPCEQDELEEYSRMASEAYWAEEEEMRQGIHPSQLEQTI